MDKGELWAEWTRRLRSLFPLPEGQTYENVQAVPGAPEQLFALISEQREDAARAEREICARIVETQYRRDADLIDEGWTIEGAKSRIVDRIAVAIRARGTEPHAREEGK